MFRFPYEDNISYLWGRKSEHFLSRSQISYRGQNFLPLRPEIWTFPTPMVYLGARFPTGDFEKYLNPRRKLYKFWIFPITKKNFWLKTWTFSETLKFTYTIKLKLTPRSSIKLSYSSEFVQESEASDCKADCCDAAAATLISVFRDNDDWQTDIVALSGDENGRLDNSDAPTEAGSEIHCTRAPWLCS